MKTTFFRSLGLRWLAAPALAAGLFLTACSNDPKATDPDKTATVVEEHKDSEVAPVTPGDSTAAGTMEERDDD
jgi:hypothetical protein